MADVRRKRRGKDDGQRTYRGYVATTANGPQRSIQNLTCYTLKGRNGQVCQTLPSSLQSQWGMLCWEVCCRSLGCSKLIIKGSTPCREHTNLKATRIMLRCFLQCREASFPSEPSKCGRALCSQRVNGKLATARSTRQGICGATT